MPLVAEPRGEALSERLGCEGLAQALALGQAEALADRLGEGLTPGEALTLGVV